MNKKLNFIKKLLYRNVLATKKVWYQKIDEEKIDKYILVKGTILECYKYCYKN